ncbi:tetratricopeptide repeat protein [Acidisoma cellulosilytica]|uniref:Tetratricopeptide repeat protein n=1 Tax=Acidisoma cellulosilyticum TaxID=2802395 RepID=A0A963Z3A4_9PROT|nr:tetratricopeptide repeat protein [Acidisoma cellulosilyticum]MCB8881974.1 tetratricopeptide repeat protein [Acidisoma cellulosilyticum]
MNRQQRRAETKQKASAATGSAAQAPSPAQMAPAQLALGEAIRLHQAGRLAEALPRYQRSLALAPNQPDALQNLGSALNDLGRPAEALTRFHQALALRPTYPIAHLNLGNAFWALGRADEAIAAYGNALAQKPDFLAAFDARALVLSGEGRFTEALSDADSALRLAPRDVQSLNTRGNVLRALGRLDEAIDSYSRAIAVAPGYADGHFNRAQALLAAGRLEDAWGEYEWRWQTPQMVATQRRFAAPIWQGEASGGQPGTGRRLLIHAEQGLGDTLQFCRYLPLVAALGFTVILEVPKPLVRICATLDGVTEVVVQGEALPAFDLHLPLMSLPGRFRTGLGSIPAATPYLSADPAAVALWQGQLGQGRLGQGLRVGLAWAGNPSLGNPSRTAMDRRRSIAPARLAPLWQVPGVHFVSLQKGKPSLPDTLPAFDVMGEMGDLADTAALVANLDLVIAVDSAVAHLAGALGKPVWLLDRTDPCWRWMLGRRDSPWYPGLTIYRQQNPGDWEAVLAEVSADLARLRAETGRTG